MELQDRARAVGQRWDYCAAGYDKIIEEERKTQEDCWLQLMTHRPVRSGTLLDVGTGPGFFAILMAKSRLAVGWDRLFGSHDRNGVA